MVAPAPPLPTADALRATGRGRWVKTDWSELPGWPQDRLASAWEALLRSCERQLRLLRAPGNGNGGANGAAAAGGSFPSAQVAATWAPTCRAAIALGGGAEEAQLREFLQERLQPWRVENPQGQAEGLLTGYFEPLLEASRQRSERFAVPLHALPADLAQRRPWYTRAQIDSLPAAQAALAGREIAWLADPMDALMLHIQGSGRLTVNEPDGTRRMVRIAFAGHNDQPYQSVGRWLVEQGAMTLEQASWPAIRAWARANPQRVREMLAVNPRYVFFREEPLADPAIGALGAQGVPLTPGRSIAVDRESIPYGTPVWLASTEPQAWQPNPPPARPLQRLVVAQDTGSAIVGAVRADLFWGWGEGIEDRAGRTKQPLRLWVLWPR
ncbi:MAG: MltA domain-containing protein [Burkholderiaceae bacterium]|nr:MltA domain-containing protein [Burkholderiaceae bacterium]